MKVFNELQKLYKEKEQDNLVIFVGAGISENYTESKGGKKYPSWGKLVDELVLEDIDKSKFDFLKIAQIFQDNNSKEALVKKIKDIFPEDSNFKDEKYDNSVHKLIFDVEPAHILTTNYDTLLEKAMRLKEKDKKYHVVDTDELIPLSKSKQNLLVKAHGDLYRGNIVLTEQDYNEYEKNFPLILSFIRYVFSKYKVLFIGFSLSDPNFNKILYWVKNILEENSIKHTVILHSDISESERIHFEKKSVNVITRTDIINEILNDKSNKDNYLSESLKFIRNGFPTQKYEAKKRLDVLKSNLRSLNYFKYLLPEMVNSFLENTYLSFKYESKAEIFKDKKKKETRYPWMSNIIQTDSYLDGTEKLDLFHLLTGDSNIIKVDKDFINKYFNDIGRMLLSTNISSLGYLNSTTNQQLIKDVLTEESKEIDFLLTYEYKKNEDNEEIEEFDKSFMEESPFFKELIFDNTSFYSDYLIGDKATAYKKCKEEEYGDDLEKYLIYFRLHYMWNNRKLNIGDEIDLDSYDVYEHIFNSMDKNNKKIFEHIHKLEFINNYFLFITDLENDFNEMEKENEHVIFSSTDKRSLYLISFYINYSRLLKFVLLNRLPIIENDIFQKAIHKSNMFYFNHFMKNQDEKSVNIPNWILIGFLIDLNKKDIESKVFTSHNKYFDNQYILTLDNSYIKNLVSSNVRNLENQGYLNFLNILYLISLSTKSEENYNLLLDLFIEMINDDIRYIERFGKSLHIAHINFTKNNNINEDIKTKLLTIFNLYIKNKLDYGSAEYKDIDDDSFASFIFDIDIDFEYKDKEEDILERLNSNFENISCRNLSSLILLLNNLGYEQKDIQKLLDLISNTFNKEDFYTKQDPFNKCPIHIENAIVKIYLHYNVDLGIKKIEENYFNILKEDLKGDGFSSRTSNSIGWLLFLIDNECLNSNVIEELKKEEIQGNLESQLFFAFKSESNLMFNSYGINIKNKLIEFLIKTDNFKIIEKVFKNLSYDKNSEYFLKMFIYLLGKYSIIEDFKDEVIKLLELTEISIHKSIILSVKQILLNSEDIEVKELKMILINILESKKDSL